MKNPDRRKFLYGAGGSMMALPWLETVAAAGATNKLKEPSLRFASFYSPMGFVRDHFFPKQDSQDFLSMPTLSPLKKSRRQGHADHGVVAGQCQRRRCAQSMQFMLPVFGRPSWSAQISLPHGQDLGSFDCRQGKPSNADSILGAELQYVQGPQRIDLLRQYLLVWARACGDVDKGSTPRLSDSFQNR